MGKPPTNQVISLLSILAMNVDWKKNPIDSEAIQYMIDSPIRSGEHFQKFLQNREKLEVKYWPIPRSDSEPGHGFELAEPEDVRSLTLREVDLTRIHLEFCREYGDESREDVTVLTRLRRLQNDPKRKHLILLDAQMVFEFQGLRGSMPLRWRDHSALLFPGTMVKTKSGLGIFSLDISSGDTWSLEMMGSRAKHPF